MKSDTTQSPGLEGYQPGQSRSNGPSAAYPTDDTIWEGPTVAVPIVDTGWLPVDEPTIGGLPQDLYAQDPVIMLKYYRDHIPTMIYLIMIWNNLWSAFFPG